VHLVQLNTTKAYEEVQVYNRMPDVKWREWSAWRCYRFTS